MKIELIDYCGSDLKVVNAARVSFDKESDWDHETDNTKLYWEKLSDKDTKLINYLAREKHFTPFTHCSITLRETVPIFVARQRFKHVVGFTYNEVSRRYVDSEPEFFTPTSWRSKAENKKQGSGDEEILVYKDYPETNISEHYLRAMEEIRLWYKGLLDSGVCPEQARMVLPQSTYTSYYVTGSLAAFARAYNLRSEETAQKEIQDLATMWKETIEPLFPVAWRALTT